MTAHERKLLRARDAWRLCRAMIATPNISEANWEQVREIVNLFYKAGPATLEAVGQWHWVGRCVTSPAVECLGFVELLSVKGMNDENWAWLQDDILETGRAEISTSYEKGRAFSQRLQKFARTGRFNKANLKMVAEKLAAELPNADDRIDRNGDGKTKRNVTPIAAAAAASSDKMPAKNSKSAVKAAASGKLQRNSGNGGVGGSGGNTNSLVGGPGGNTNSLVVGGSGGDREGFGA